MSTTAVNGTITFQSNGNSPVILREVAEMVEGFQRLQLPVAVTITVMLDGEMAMPAVKEAPAATANFPMADGQSAARAPVREEEEQRSMGNGQLSTVDRVDWKAAGLSEDARDALTALENGETTWRRIRKDIRLELVQAVLIQDTGSGKAMTMGEFDRLRPAWMPGSMGLPTTFGCAWSELPGLRLSE